MGLGIEQSQKQVCQHCGKSWLDHDGPTLICKRAEERLRAIREIYCIAVRKTDPELKAICERILAAC